MDHLYKCIVGICHPTRRDQGFTAVDILMITWINLGNQLIEHVLTLLWFDPLNFVLYHYDLCVIVEFQKTWAFKCCYICNMNVILLLASIYLFIIICFKRLLSVDPRILP